ncbi:hypothetical protein AOLI_G00147050 [Acnodon oligacanthus]
MWWRLTVQTPAGVNAWQPMGSFPHPEELNMQCRVVEEDPLRAERHPRQTGVLAAVPKEQCVVYLDASEFDEALMCFGEVFEAIRTTKLKLHPKKCSLLQPKKGAAECSHVQLQSLCSSAPMERFGVDVLGPFPETERGNKYIMVAMDYFTK